MRKNTEIHIVIDFEGIRCVQVVGDSNNHEVGHDLYFKIKDLITDWDSQVKERLVSTTSDENSRGFSNA